MPSFSARLTDRFNKRSSPGRTNTADETNNPAGRQTLYHFPDEPLTTEVDLSYLRPEKKEKVRTVLDAFRYRGDLSAVSYKDALVLPGKGIKTGGVLDNNGDLVEASTSPWFGGSYDLEDHEQIRDDAREVVYLGNYASECWGHAFGSLLVRFWYCLANHEDIDAYVIVCGRPGQKQDSTALNDLIRLAGIGDKVVYVSDPTRFKRVVVPDPSFTPGYYSDEYWKTIDRIKENALNEAGEAVGTLPKKVFLSRSHFRRARKSEGGLELLDDYFERNGFTILYPEEYSLSQMVKIMDNVEICASESGSITLNTLFGNSNLQVIVVERIALYPNSNLMTNLSRAKRITHIDGNYVIYPTNTGGAAILGFTDEFERFARDRQHRGPKAFYTSIWFRRRCFSVFRKHYFKMNTYERWLNDGKLDWLPVVHEAFSESIRLFPWLNREEIEKNYYLGQAPQSAAKP